MPPAANTILTYEVNNPQAQAVTGAAVTAQLIGAGDRNDEGTVITSQVSTTTDANGAFSLSLVPNSAYRQANTYYVVNIANGPSYSIVVPVSGSAVSLWDCRVDPTTLTPSTVVTPPVYLARSERGVASGVASLGADGLVPASQLPAGASTPDATSTVKGILKLTNDLGGTADLPTVPGLAGKQAADADLTAIAGLTPANDDVLQRKAGAWTNRTPAQVKADLGLAKADVGLGNVDNTSDASKPISTATQTALNAKAALSHGHAYDKILSAYGFVAATGEPLDFGSTANPSGNDHLIVLIPAPAGTTIASIKAHSNAAATYSATGVPAQCKAYDFDGALLGTTPDDSTLWLAGGWRTCTFAATFVVPANGLIYVGLSFGGFTGAGVAVPTGSPASTIFEGLTGGKRWAIYNGGGALPASFNPASYGLTTNWAPLIGVIAA